MSRVDEALRRAAEEGTAVSASGNPAVLEETPPAGTNLVDLASEPFPIEIGERRRNARANAPHLVKQVSAHPEPAPASPGEQVAPEALSRPLLERMDQALVQKVVIDGSMMATSREQYRRLAATLHHAQTAKGLKVVMIVSAAPGEGKTLTASNLALTFSESYKRTVLLIDADLRRPALHTVFGTDNASGLTEGLTSHSERQLPVRQVSERLALLQAGQASSDPMAGLTSDRMRRVIAEARESFDWVIIDSPPVGLLPDANLLGAMVDGAVIVVKAGVTSYLLVKRAIEAIGRTRIIGVVLNGADAVSHGDGYDSYYGGYRLTPEDRTGV